MGVTFFLIMHRGGIGMQVNPQMAGPHVENPYTVPRRRLNLGRDCPIVEGNDHYLPDPVRQYWQHTMPKVLVA